MPVSECTPFPEGRVFLSEMMHYFTLTLHISQVPEVDAPFILQIALLRGINCHDQLFFILRTQPYKWFYKHLLTKLNSQINHGYCPLICKLCKGLLRNVFYDLYFTKYSPSLREIWNIIIKN